MDADGYFWFQARTDDMIISSGYNISGFEVETALLEHPLVKEAAVVGVPDEARGHVVKAFVVTTETVEAGVLQDFVKARIAPYKYPRRVEFLEATPAHAHGQGPAQRPAGARMRRLQPPGWPEPRGYANGVEASGRLVFVAGQIGWDETGTFVSDALAAQVEQALRNVVAVLAEAGAGPEHVVRLTWYVTSRNEYLRDHQSRRRGLPLGNGADLPADVRGRGQRTDGSGGEGRDRGHRGGLTMDRCANI